ncbi:hypothetical protein V8J88_20680 [Massilia sp. W12]|uniref:hypothetical protein n=1 Tax=Massilia sp. W12 TaxID=3126507 RepID=UPI0030D07E9A
MNIKGIEHLSNEELQAELAQGARFVIFQYCISVLVMSFKRNSPIYFIPAQHKAAPRSLRFIGISLLAGWWSLPWGPIWTWRTVKNNIKGGIDVTRHVQQSLSRAA